MRQMAVVQMKRNNGAKIAEPHDVKCVKIAGREGKWRLGKAA